MPHWLDITVLAILVLSLVYSLFKGFVNEVFSLLSILFASIVATRYCFLGGVYLAGIVESKKIAYMVGFVFLFLITTTLIRLLGMAINSFIKKIGLTLPNRLLGGVLGIIKGSLLVSVFLLVLITFSQNGVKTIGETRWTNYFLPISEFIAEFLPHSLLDSFKSDYKRIMSQKKSYERQRDAEHIREKIRTAIKEDKEKLQKILKDNL